MKNNKILLTGYIIFLLVSGNVVSSFGQREGAITKGTVTKHILISNGPQGPVLGGESAVTDMILMNDGWVYGSTKATWGAQNCHLFRTDGEKVEHVLNVTSKFRGQTSVNDLCVGRGNVLFGCTSTYNDVLDDSTKSYEGGHLFSFDPVTKKSEDFGIIAAGQGINCIVVDSVREKIYGVTYPSGHLFSYDMNTRTTKDIGEVMKPWRVKDLGRVSWRGIPKILMLDDAGTLYFSAYYHKEVGMTKQELMKGGISSYSVHSGGLIYRLNYGDEKPVFTGAKIPTQQGMDSDPLYENGIASAIRARDGGFWCGTINDGFLFKFHPSTSTVINKGKAFQYWNLKSLAYGGDGKLYLLGGRDEDNSWILCYDPVTGSIDCLGWPDNTAQCSIICADRKGRILIAENLRHSFIWIYEPEK
ncbi:hypothetical protein AQPE_0312 [Aquipluma nitroreducens]|uniref:Uncharacterized protein n=1 Tax=Aquipluma nitroreducens TaxID=2010828 RepID=A0A5K7S3X2_9BACT|nr:hypothetical protein [Aquipluma nitroreducens]BBE16175.1 hypothetical protein AQPE_0312 [Aquipluma nitroreducens]